MTSDLCDLGELKQWLRITDSNNKDDTLLETLITGASAAMLNKMNRTDLASASYSETRSGNGGQTLALKNFPVTAVASLTVGAIAIPSSAGGVKSGYVFDQFSISLIGFCFTWGVGNIAVTYTAGYAEIPADVEQACMEWCAFKYRQKDRIGQTSKHLNTGETVSFSQKDMPDSVAAVIQQYTRRVPV